MKAIHIQTLLFTQTITYVLCTLVVAMVWFRNRSRFTGLGFCLANLILQTVALVLVMLQDFVPQWASLVHLAD